MKEDLQSRFIQNLSDFQEELLLRQSLFTLLNQFRKQDSETVDSLIRSQLGSIYDLDLAIEKGDSLLQLSNMWHIHFDRLLIPSFFIISCSRFEYFLSSLVSTIVDLTGRKFNKKSEKRYIENYIDYLLDPKTINEHREQICIFFDFRNALVHEGGKLNENRVIGCLPIIKKHELTHYPENNVVVIDKLSFLTEFNTLISEYARIIAKECLVKNVELFSK